MIYSNYVLYDKHSLAIVYNKLRLLDNWVYKKKF